MQRTIQQLLRLPPVALAFAVTAAAAAGPEYRLIDKDGVPFHWAEGKEQLLGQKPFMTAADFGRAIPVDPHNPNQPGKRDVLLTHTAIGKAKFRAVADADRSREYCLVFEVKILTCVAFPPPMKDLYERGTPISGGYSRSEANALAQRINRTLK